MAQGFHYCTSSDIGFTLLNLPQLAAPRPRIPGKNYYQWCAHSQCKNSSAKLALCSGDVTCWCKQLALFLWLFCSLAFEKRQPIVRAEIIPYCDNFSDLNRLVSKQIGFIAPMGDLYALSERLRKKCMWLFANFCPLTLFSLAPEVLKVPPLSSVTRQIDSREKSEALNLTQR